MITEEYVSFDTANMLKEAGFKEPCRCMYDLSPNREYKLYQNLIGDYMVSENYYSQTYILAPSQALAARWLREEHHISILLTPLLDGWMVDLFNIEKFQYILCNQDTDVDTYEEALEDGLQEVLRAIIKRKEAQND